MSVNQKKLKGGLSSAKDRDANHLGLRSGVASIKLVVAPGRKSQMAILEA